MFKEIKINADLVSHIKVFDRHEGVCTSSRNWVKLVYLNEKKKWHRMSSYPAGYYEDGLYDDSGWSLYKTPLEMSTLSSKIEFVGDTIFTKPHIEIYSGGKLIHTEYFDSFTDLTVHLNKNYKNVNKTYEL